MEMSYEAIEAYARMMRDRIYEEHRLLVAEPSHVKRVIRIDEDGVQHALQIEHVAVTLDGTTVFVR